MASFRVREQEEMPEPASHLDPVRPTVKGSEDEVRLLGKKAKVLY